jgi:hypothetical protein
MWNLQHVRCNVSPDREQLLLGFDLRIARQEDSNSVTFRPQHERRVVWIGPSAAKRVRRTEHLESDGPNPQTKADRRRLGLQVARPQRVGDEGGAGFRLGKWACDHPAHPAPTEHTSNATNVVHVIMREHE